MQLNFFGGTEPLKITKPIRLVELFGGIGCQAHAVNSNSRLYKQAGNGIVIPVLEQIFKELL
ncbi:MAG: hypothetical protein RSA24_06590 [Clostridia bacterium]